MSTWYQRTSLGVAVGILLVLVFVVADPAAAPPPPPSQPVTVTNTPLPVSVGGTIAVQAAPVEPVWAGGSDRFFDTCCQAIDIYEVPAGKRLFVEYVSASGLVPSGQTVFGSFRFGSRSHSLVFVPQGIDVVGEAHFRAADGIRGFAEAGETVTVILNKSADAGSMLVSARFTGYLVDA